MCSRLAGLLFFSYTSATMHTNFRIFLASFSLLLATPFLVVGGLAFPYQSTRIIAFSLAIIGILGTTLWRLTRDSDFKEKISGAARNPVVVVYGIFIAWLFVRSLPVFLAESWWGTWIRFDGLLFESAFLLAIVAVAAWLTDSQFIKHQKTMLMILAAVFIGSVVIFPLLGLDRFVEVLPAGRFMGSVGNPLYLAGILLFVPWIASRARNNWLTIASVIVSILLIALTQTRGAYLALAVAAVVYVLEQQQISKKIRISVALVSAILLVVGASLILLGRIELTRSVTIATRVAMWKSGAAQLMQQPLIGFGLGVHRDIIDRSSADLSQVSYGEITDSTHSAYLDLLLKGGLIALALFIVWSVVVYRSLGGDSSALKRATFVAYLALIATSPYMVWTAIPLIFLIGDGMRLNKSRYVENIFRGAAGVVMISSLVVVVVMMRNASYIQGISAALSAGRFVNLPKNQMITNKFLPFTKDSMIEVLRLSMPTQAYVVAPNLVRYSKNIVEPVFAGVKARPMHPDALNVASTWANLYGSYELSGTKAAWFAESLVLQDRALAINSDRPAAVFQRADTLRELGRLPEAIESLAKFSERVPGLLQARIKYAMMIDISGDSVKAFEIIQQAKKDFPNYDWSPEYAAWITELEIRAQKPRSK